MELFLPYKIALQLLISVSSKAICLRDVVEIEIQKRFLSGENGNEVIIQRSLRQKENMLNCT